MQRRRAVDAGETSQQSGGDDGDGSDRLHVHAYGRTDGRPAEDERCGVTPLRDGYVTSDPQQLTQIQSLSAAHTLMQHLRDRRRFNVR